jgi:hypothetical protein
MGLHPWCRDCVREYKRNNQASHGRPVRKVQALPGASPRVQRPTRTEIREFLEKATVHLHADGSRFKAYLIHNEITHEGYVGITERSLAARWKQHIESAFKRSGYLLHDKIGEYGLRNFSFHHLASAKSRSDLNRLEQILVQQFDTVERGYNQTRGGSAGEAVGGRVVVEGLPFISLNAAARHYGVPEATIHQRVNRYGWSLEEALEIVRRPRKRHKIGTGYELAGSTFDNFSAACRLHGLDEAVVRSRLKIGWSKEQAFGLQPRPKRRGHNGKAVTIDGVEYESVATAAKARGLSAQLIASRTSRGWTSDEAFGLKAPPAHKKLGVQVMLAGVSFTSVSDACRAYSKDAAVVSARLRTGWSIEQAFDLSAAPRPSGEKNGMEVTVCGVTYSSRAKAARAHGLDPRVVHKRLNVFGWTLTQAFGLEPRPG